MLDEVKNNDTHEISDESTRDVTGGSLIGMGKEFLDTAATVGKAVAKGVAKAGSSVKKGLHVLSDVKDGLNEQAESWKLKKKLERQELEKKVKENSK